MEDRAIEAFIATGQQKHGAAAADGGKAQGAKVEQMRERLRRDGFANPYHLRKRTVEPVFGQIKQARGFRQFLMRGGTRSLPSGRSCAPSTTSTSWRGHKDR